MVIFLAQPISLFKVATSVNVPVMVIVLPLLLVAPRAEPRSRGVHYHVFGLFLGAGGLGCLVALAHAIWLAL